MIRSLAIERLGHRGDGVAPGPVFVPYALPGETVTAEVAGDRGRLVSVEVASPSRILPFCPYFGTCGGCAIQHLAAAEYRAWKRGLVATALAQAGLSPPLGELVDAHGLGRRRATLHARRGRLGFAVGRSHELVDIATCPILVPQLQAAIPGLREVEKRLRHLGKPLDLQITATEGGVDLDIRGSGRIDERTRLALAAVAGELDLARLSLHGDIVVERRPPLLRFGKAALVPPPGGFLQATEAADRVLADLVLAGAAGARRVADLFSGSGTLSLRLAQAATVLAVDSDRAALAALDRAARGAAGLRPLTTTQRDLFHRPLLPPELAAFDAVVFDPPRAGAEAQSRRLAASKVPRLVAVSCNAATFARDAALLTAGGYQLETVTPVDQFRHSAHVELVGLFRR
jgi:23S rRNA (uracil1939-C5)-methyltransferase